jgi:Flp pilus assembly protein TadG
MYAPFRPVIPRLASVCTIPESAESYMQRAKNRRGVMLVVGAVFIVAALSFLAFVVDLSRIYVQKNELQTAADAAALAGVIELTDDTLAVADSASSFSEKNKVFKKAISIPAGDVVCGIWDDDAGTFTPAANCGLQQNAVAVTTRDSASYAFSLLFTQDGKEVQRTSTAFLAFVNGSACVKPWGIPYPQLTKTLDPGNPDTLRELNQSDLEKLATWPPEMLTFTVKYGDPTSPGNFGILELPGSTGGNDYRDDIATCNPVLIEIGDTLSVMTGNKVGPTLQGAADLCQPLMANGACEDGKGNTGLVVVAPLYYTPEVCNGTKCDVIIKNLVSFSLDTVTSDANVIGHFVAFTSGGTIGGTPSTIRRPILVK